MRSLQRVNAFFTQYHEQLHVARYESYVAGDFADLDDHLGLRLQPGQVRSAERRVDRRGGHGDWRHWFNQTDVIVFRPLTSKWLKRFGYDHDDWELDPAPSIDAESSVDYVTSLLAEVEPAER